MENGWVNGYSLVGSMTAVACSTRFQISLHPVPVSAEDITTDGLPKELEMTRNIALLWLFDNLSDLVATSMRGIFSPASHSDKW